MSTNQGRKTAIIHADLVGKVEDYRYDNRFPTLTQAINHLIEKGLDAAKKPVQEAT
jgi:hypothetical protein